MHIAFALQDPSGTGPITDYVRGLASGLRELGHRIDVVHGGGALPPEARPVLDGDLLPALLPERDALLGRGAVGLVRDAGAGSAGPAADEKRAALREWLPRIGRTVVTSTAAADRLAAEIGVARERLAVVPPGVADAPRSPGSGISGCALLAVGALAPSMGHDVLLQAVARLPDLDWSLTIAGAAAQDQAHAALLMEHARQPPLAGRVRIHADPDPGALDALWRGADVFALAIRREGHAGTVMEAIRRGLPVATIHGTPVPDGAGTTSPIDDDAALSKCLRRMIFDTALRRAMADAAWRAGQGMPSWTEQAALFAGHVR